MAKESLVNGLTRFAAVNSDPRFKRQKRKESRVKIDARFKDMFTEKDFVHPVNKDKYGRRHAEGEEKVQLKRFYELDDQDSEDEEEHDLVETEQAAVCTSSESDSEEEDSDDSYEGEALMDQVMSSHPLVNAETPLGEASKRLAVVNMDWDQIKAIDILSFALAFKPPGGCIQSVSIYPSEFGKERLASEAITGPFTTIYRAEGQDESSSEVVEMQLRKYQLDRLKYYYAVISCDSVETACAIYKACDGSEFEQSGNIVDLRYIPDDMDFADDPVDIATVSDRAKYRGKSDMSTAALQNSTVKLTWDMDDPERSRITKNAASLCGLTKAQRKKVDIRDVDMAAYLASSSEDDENENSAKIEEYRKKLLQSSNENVFGRKSKDEVDKDLNITFASAFSKDDADGAIDAEATFDMEADNNGPSGSDDEDELTVFQKEQLKRKQKKSERKAKRRAELKEQKSVPSASAAELAALLNGSEAVNRFDLEEEVEERPRKNRNKKTESESKVDINDPRFAAIYDQPEYAIDPSLPSFKRTAGMQSLLEERAKRRNVMQ